MTETVGSVDSAPGPARNQVRILLVEDDPLSQEMILRQLEVLGFSAQVASDAMEALASWQEQPFDVVFLTCDSPCIDVFEVAGIIRRFEAEGMGCLFAPCSVVAVTSSRSIRSRKRYLSASMNACLGRPVDSERLRMVLELAMRGNGRRERAGTPTASMVGTTGWAPQLAELATT